MTRYLISVLALIALCTAAAAQERTEQQESGLSSWLKSIRHKLDIVNPRKTLPVTTGVAGVRGAKQDEKGKLYWKGKQGDDQVSEAELQELKAAVELAERGETAAAVTELEEFLEQFPDSALVPDAKRTLDLVKAAPKAEAPQEPKAEPMADGQPETPAPVASASPVQEAQPLPTADAPAADTN